MTTLDDLDEAQLAQILQHLVSAFDTEELAITDEEIAERDEQDRQFLAAAAQPLSVPTEPFDDVSLRDVIETLADSAPETVPIIEETAAGVRQLGALPISEFASEILVVAASAAVLRPKFTFRRTGKGLDIKFEAGDSKVLANVLQTILGYLRYTP